MSSSSSSSSSWVELLDQGLENLSNPETPNIPSSLIKSRKKQKKNVTFLHFLHKHPLVLTKNKKRKINWSLRVAERNEATQICQICGECIGLDGQLYQCKKCSFSIHKSCAKLPKQVRNMLHPAHILELSIGEDGYDSDACSEDGNDSDACSEDGNDSDACSEDGYVCDACNAGCSGASYECYDQCSFKLGVKCIASNIFEEPQGHKEHHFRFMKPNLFTCDACGVKEVTDSSISCVCTTCLLQVHRDCISSSFPFTIKEPRHVHKLNLTYSFQMGDLDFADKLCKLCFHEMNNVLFMYSCDQCAYITHVRCGVSANVLDVDLVGEIESLSLSPSTLRSAETHQNDQIEHFSHPHSLFLNIEEPEGDNIIICDGCVRPISVPFFACDQCNFFLHRDCVELPNKIYSPLHAHELTLITTWDTLSNFRNTFISKFVPGFECYGCKTLCNGFMYKCDDCDFSLDVGCSFLPGTLQLKCHECVSEIPKIKEGRVCVGGYKLPNSRIDTSGELTLIDTIVQQAGLSWVNKLDKFKSNCNACGLSCVNKFICEGCNFNLDLVCASLPKMIPHDCPKHGWKKHPFKLKYHDIEHVSRMYFCDECEEERSIKQWYYYCEDCKYSAHPRCLVGHNRTKYGRSYKIKEHPHRVQLLKEPRLGWKHTCATCREPLEESGPALSCKECNIYFHSEPGCFCLDKSDPDLKHCINVGSQ